MENTKYIIIRKIHERQEQGFTSGIVSSDVNFSDGEINRIIPFVKIEFPNIEIRYVKNAFQGGTFVFNLNNKTKIKDAKYIRELQMACFIKHEKIIEIVNIIINDIEKKINKGYTKLFYDVGIENNSFAYNNINEIIDELEKLDFTAEYENNILKVWWNAD